MQRDVQRKFRFDASESETLRRGRSSFRGNRETSAVPISPKTFPSVSFKYASQPSRRARKGSGVFLGLPLGLVVLSRLNRTALLFTHCSSSNGRPRRRLVRMALTSSSVSVWSPHSRQVVGN